LGRDIDWFKVYGLAWFLSGLSNSIYYTYSRPYLRETLGLAGYYAVSLLIVAEQAPLLMGIFTGFLADRIGRRKLLLLGLLNSPLYLLLGLINPWYIPLLVALISLNNSLSGPAGLGVVLDAVNRSGKAYSLIAMAAALGWTFGGIVPGLLKDVIGTYGLFLSVALLAIIPPILQYIFYPSGKVVYRRVGYRELFRAISLTKYLSLSLILSTASLSLYYNLVALRIYDEIKNLLVFGLFFSSITALAGALMRPLAGYLVDKSDPWRIFVISLTLYLFLDTAIYFSSGYIALILYVTPIYPFRDTATTILYSRTLSRELQATAAGLITTSTSLAGLLILILTPLIKGNLYLAYIIHMLLIIASIILLTIRKYKTITNAQ